MGFGPVCRYMQWLRDDADADMYGYKARIDADWEALAGVNVLDAVGGKYLRDQIEMRGINGGEPCIMCMGRREEGHLRLMLGSLLPFPRHTLAEGTSNK